MKYVYPGIALVGGGLCAAVRFWNLQVGFDPMTGLVVYGDTSGLILAAVVAVCVLLCVVLAWKSPDKEELPLRAFTPDTVALGCFVAGALGLVVSGGLEIVSAFGVSQTQLLIGCLVAGSGAGLLSQVGHFSRNTSKDADCTLFLLPVLASVVLLILEYRTSAINPVTGAYYIEVLALCATLLALFALAGFTVSLGRSRLFYGSAMLGIILSCACLVEDHPLATTAYFASLAVFLLGCLLGYKPENV